MPKLGVLFLTSVLAVAQVQLVNPSLPVAPIAIATDRAGNIFVMGLSSAATSSQSAYLLAKYADDGTTLLWSVSLHGDKLATSVEAMAVDITGNVILAGTSSASGLPGSGLLGSVWVTSVDPFGNVVYSSTFGEDDNQIVSGIAVDMLGNAYVAGSTISATFPVTPDAAQSTYGGDPADGFLAILNNAGVLTYATFLGGAVPKAVGVDSKSRIAIGGFVGTQDQAYLTRLEQPGGSLQPITSIAGALSVDALAIGSDDSIYVSGLTNSPDFAVTRTQFANPFNASPSFYTSAGRFLQRLQPDTAQPFYSAVLGTDTSFGNVRLVIRPDGAAILQGYENEMFPQRAPLYMGSGGFWTEVAPDASALRYSGVLAPDFAVPAPMAMAPGGTLLATTYPGLYRVTIPAAAEISLDYVANAFSGLESGLAGGGIYELGGEGIGPETAMWLGFDAVDPPVELGGVRVRFDDLYARLLYVSANRIICIAPDAPAYGSVRVEFARKRSNAVFVVNGAEPGLLTASFPNAGPRAYAENPDGSVNGPDNPVAAGAPIVLYETGAVGDYLCGMRPVPGPANIALDPRFAGKIYRISCIAPKQTGPVDIGLMEIRGDNPFIPVIQTYGNFVTIYVK